MRATLLAVLTAICLPSHATLITIEYEGVVTDVYGDNDVEQVGDPLWGTLRFDTDASYYECGAYDCHWRAGTPENPGGPDMFTGYHSVVGVDGGQNATSAEFLSLRRNSVYLQDTQYGEQTRNLTYIGLVGLPFDLDETSLLQRIEWNFEAGADSVTAFGEMILDLGAAAAREFSFEITRFLYEPMPGQCSR